MFSLTAQMYTGKVENWAFSGCANTACNKSVTDFVGTYHVTPQITVVGNVDLGQQTNTFSPAFTSFVGTTTWKGVAGYVSDAFSPKFTGSFRYEWFADFQGFRMGTGTGTTWSEGTLTASYAAAPNLTLRAEGRADKASQPFFVTKTGIIKTNIQYSLEAIVHAP